MSEHPVMTAAPEPEAQHRDKRTRVSHRFGLKLLLATFASLLAILFCEATVRLLIPVTDHARMIWDPNLGVRPGADQSGVFYRGRSIRGDFRFNGSGWNSPHEYMKEKESGTIRVCLLGDSEAEGQYVPNDQMMSVSAERAMDRPDHRVEWYSFACSGFGTHHEYLALKHEVMQYQPDAVILLFVDNDVYDSSPYLGTVVKTSPAFMLNDDHSLALMEPVEQEFSIWGRLARHFAMYRLLKIQNYFGGEVVFDRTRPPIFFRAGAGDPKQSHQAGAGMSQPEREQKSWELIEALLGEMKSICDDSDIPFGLVYRGCRPRVYQAWDGRSYDPPAKEVDPWCLNERIFEMGRSQLAPICQRLGIEYLDLTDTLIASVKKTGRRHDFVEDTHLNADSHRAVGAALGRLAERLIQEGDFGDHP